ncbi:hypothetical protein H696_00973 [Fonticula alba]|uniref:CDF family cation efflux system protein n=1 Tax=Fonticula alba TaxID=691883 RepID=A0A058ZHJ6_FONAL|nr:hypothetical protein H696_00973 [Fonticula alba]KCV73436.1 hypothetical protein H696_00973 [Fonticula alba]|eukprot:XP_009493137.1 hypothetical protein H696_00973 [Fonticula alba]
MSPPLNRGTRVHPDSAGMSASSINADDQDAGSLSAADFETQVMGASASSSASATPKKPWWKWRTLRLSFTLGLSCIIFFAEVIVGSITHSNALMADAFHVLSDMLGLVIGIAAIQIGKRDRTPGNYRAKRIEVFGALVNGVFVLALCLSIVMSAVGRFFRPEEIEDPQLLLVTGSIGLVANIIGLVVVGHGGHGHSHSHGGHSHGAPADTPLLSAAAEEDGDDEDDSHSHSHSHGDDHGHSHGEHGHSHGGSASAGDDSAGHGHAHSHGPGGDLNIRGVFLHILGDALASVAVVISALIITYSDWEYVNYVDPALSLLITLILIMHSIPLVRATADILLLDPPKQMNMNTLREEILDIPGVRAIHDLYVWQLTGERVIGSAHVGMTTPEAYAEIGPKIHAAFHRRGVHSVTIQPEYVGHGPMVGLLPSPDAPADGVKSGAPTAPPQTPMAGLQSPSHHHPAYPASSSSMSSDVLLHIMADTCFLDCSSLAGTDERCKAGGLPRRRLGTRANAARRACGNPSFLAEFEMASNAAAGGGTGHPVSPASSPCAGTDTHSHHHGHGHGHNACATTAVAHGGAPSAPAVGTLMPDLPSPSASPSMSTSQSGSLLD